MSVKHKTNYRPSMGELERVRNEEIDRRRKLRLKQVREQAKNNAAIIRERVRQKKVDEVKKVAMKIQREMIESNSEEIHNLEQKYQSALNELGQAHDTAFCWVDPTNEERFETEKLRAVADDRFNLALDKLRDDEAVKKAKYNNWLEAKSSALKAERQRSELIASLPKPDPPPYVLNPSAFQKVSGNVQIFDQGAASTSHTNAGDVTRVRRELPDSDKENDRQVVSPDARERAEFEWGKISELNRAKDVQGEEFKVKAQLRGREAEKKEMVKQSYDKMMSELENLHRGDLVRRQRAYNSIPKQIFAVPNRLREENRSLERQREKAFENVVINAADSSQNKMMETMRLIGPVSGASHCCDSTGDYSLSNILPEDEPNTLRGYQLYSDRDDVPRNLSTGFAHFTKVESKAMSDSGVIVADQETENGKLRDDHHQEKRPSSRKHAIEETLMEESTVTKEKLNREDVLDRLFQRIKKQRFNWLVKGRSDETEEAEKEILSARLCSDISELEKDESEIPEKETRAATDSQMNDISLDRSSEERPVSRGAAKQNPIESEAEMRARLVDRLLSRAEIERENQKLEEENKYLDSRIESIRQRGIVPPASVTIKPNLFHHVKQTINANGRVSEFTTLPRPPEALSDRHQRDVTCDLKEKQHPRYLYPPSIRSDKRHEHGPVISRTIRDSHRRSTAHSNEDLSDRQSPRSQISTASSVMNLAQVRAFQNQALTKFKLSSQVGASGDAKETDVSFEQLEEKESAVKDPDINHIKQVGGVVMKLADLKLQSVHDRMSRLTATDIPDDKVIEETRKRLTNRQASLETEKENLFQRYLSIRLNQDMKGNQSIFPDQSSASPLLQQTEAFISSLGETLKPFHSTILSTEKGSHTRVEEFCPTEQKTEVDGDESSLSADDSPPIIPRSNSTTPRNKKKMRQRRKKVKNASVSSSRWKHKKSIIKARSIAYEEDSASSDERESNWDTEDRTITQKGGTISEEVVDPREDYQIASPTRDLKRDDSCTNWSSDINACLKSLIELSPCIDDQQRHSGKNSCTPKDSSKEQHDSKIFSTALFSDPEIKINQCGTLFQMQQNSSPPPEIHIDPADLSIPSFATDEEVLSNTSQLADCEQTGAEPSLLQMGKEISLTENHKRFPRPTRPPVSSTRHLIGPAELVNDFVPHELSQIQESLLQSNSSIVQLVNQSTAAGQQPPPTTIDQVQSGEANLERTLIGIEEVSDSHGDSHGTPSATSHDTSSATTHISQFSASSHNTSTSPQCPQSRHMPLSSSPRNENQPPPSFVPPPLSSISSGSRSSSVKSMKEDIMSKYFQMKLFEMSDTEGHRPAAVQHESPRLEEKKDSSKEDMIRSDSSKSQSTRIKESASSGTISVTQRQSLPPCPSPFTKSKMEASPSQGLEVSQFSVDSLSLSQSIMQNDLSVSSHNWFVLNHYSSSNSDSLKFASPPQPPHSEKVSQYAASSTDDQSHLQDPSSQQICQYKVSSTTTTASSSCTTADRQHSHHHHQLSQQRAVSSSTSSGDAVSTDVTQYRASSSSTNSTSVPPHSERVCSQYAAASLTLSTNSESVVNKPVAENENSSSLSMERSSEELPTFVERRSSPEDREIDSDNAAGNEIESSKSAQFSLTKSPHGEKGSRVQSEQLVRRSLQELASHSPLGAARSLSGSLLSFKNHELSCSDKEIHNKKQNFGSDYDLHQLAKLKISKPSSSNMGRKCLSPDDQEERDCTEQPGPTGDQVGADCKLSRPSTLDVESKELMKRALEDWQQERSQKNLFTNFEFIQTIKSALDSDKMKLKEAAESPSEVVTDNCSNPTPVVPRLNLDELTTPSGCSSNATSSRVPSAPTASHSNQDSGVTTSRTIDSAERKRLTKEALTRTNRLWNQLEEVKEKRLKEDREKKNKENREKAKMFIEKQRENTKKGRGGKC